MIETLKKNLKERMVGRVRSVVSTGNRHIRRFHVESEFALQRYGHFVSKQEDFFKGQEKDWITRSEEWYWVPSNAFKWTIQRNEREYSRKVCLEAKMTFWASVHEVILDNVRGQESFKVTRSRPWFKILNERRINLKCQFNETSFRVSNGICGRIGDKKVSGLDWIPNWLLRLGPNSSLAHDWKCVYCPVALLPNKN